MKRLALLLAAAVLVLAACSSDGGDDNASDTSSGGDTATTVAGDTTDTGGDAVDTADLPSFEDVAEIGAALGCDLEYDGIVDANREFSICVFEDEQATIYVFTDPAAVADVAAAGAPALVYGANWTIEVETAAVAEAVAEATGGAVAAP